MYHPCPVESHLTESNQCNLWCGEFGHWVRWTRRGPMISGTWTGSTAESHASLFSKVRDRHTLPADTHETSKRTLPPDILQRRPGSFEFLTSDNINNGFSKFINVARHLSSLATFASPFWPGWFWVWVCHKHHAITWACFNFLNPIRPIPSHGSIIGPTPISLITSPWNPLVPSSIVSHIRL